MKCARSTTLSVLALLLAALFNLPAHAQTARAQVQGIVTDSTGASVPRATVTLLNVNTGVSTVRQTSDSGLYLFDLVNPGSYSVTVEATGFPKFTQPNVQVQ